MAFLTSFKPASMAENCQKLKKDFEEIKGIQEKYKWIKDSYDGIS